MGDLGFFGEGIVCVTFSQTPQDAENVVEFDTEDWRLRLNAQARDPPSHRTITRGGWVDGE